MPLLDDEKVERLFAEKRPSNDDLHGGDFCLQYVQGRQRKDVDDVWRGSYMITPQLGDRTFELVSGAVVSLHYLSLFVYSDLCKCCNFAFSRCLTFWMEIFTSIQVVTWTWCRVGLAGRKWLGVGIEVLWHAYCKRQHSCYKRIAPRVGKCWRVRQRCL